MPFACKNPKCVYYGTERCFSRRCTEPCENSQCDMFGQDHFAQGCRLKCKHPDCVKYGQYHPPGECFFRQANSGYDQQYTSPPPPEAKQAALDFYQQTLSTVGQNFQAQSMMANQLTPSLRPQGQMSFPPFPPAMGNNSIFYPPNQSGWPNGQ